MIPVCVPPLHKQRPLGSVDHLSALHLPLCFVLLDESVLLRNVKFWSSIWELFPGACLFGLRKQLTFGDGYHWFPRQIMSEKLAQKFHSDDASLPRSD